MTRINGYLLGPDLMTFHRLVTRSPSIFLSPMLGHATRQPWLGIQFGVRYLRLLELSALPRSQTRGNAPRARPAVRKQAIGPLARSHQSHWPSAVIHRHKHSDLGTVPYTRLNYFGKSRIKVGATVAEKSEWEL